MNIIEFPFELYSEKHIDMAENRFNFSEYIKKLNIYNDFIFHDFAILTTVPDENNNPLLTLKFSVEFQPDNNQLLVFDVAETAVGKRPILQKYQWIHKENDYSQGVCWLLPPNPKNETEQNKRIAKDMARILLFAMTYIMDTSLQRTHQNKTVYSDDYKCSRKHKISPTNKKVYLLDDIVNYVYKNFNRSKSHHQISCPCWEVRGHYRHYKNGKTIFIRSYKKGKQRETSEPKSKNYYL